MSQINFKIIMINSDFPGLIFKLVMINFDLNHNF